MKRFAVSLLISLSSLCVSFAQIPFVFSLDSNGKWEYDTYRIDYPDLKSQVTLRLLTDTLMRNGHTYHPFSNGVGAVFYLRQSGEQVLCYNQNNSSEFLWFDPAKVPGDTLAFVRRQFDSSVVIFKFEDMPNILGSPRKVRHIGSQDGYVSYGIADSVGICYFLLGLSFRYELTSAFVNGITYGQITRVPHSFEYQSSPAAPMLHQNFPNPFNPSAEITFDLSIREKVTLTVINVLGQIVETLLDGEAQAGINVVRWTPEHIPSGLYLYTLRTRTGLRTRTMLYLK